MKNTLPGWCTYRQLNSAASSPFYLYWSSLQQDLDAVLAHDFCHLIGHIRVFTVQQILSPLHNGYLAAEATEHLAKFQPDIATTYHQQMLRHYIQFHDRGRVQHGYLIQST